MILHNDTMANGLNPGSSHMQVNSLVNRRLKLPPIATLTNYNGKHNNRPLHGNIDLKSNEDFNLPRVNFNAHGLQNPVTFTGKNIPKDREDLTFSLPRVYTVLPPIGQKFVPSAPNTVNIPNAPSSVRQIKRPSRRPRVKKQPRDSHVENVSNPETVVDNESLIRTSVVDSGKINSESICIDIPDSVQPKIEVNLVQTQDKTNSNLAVTVKSDSEKHSEKKVVSLGPNAIYATISDDAYSDNERGSETPFPQFSTIPDELRLYADVYPPSPPPEERKAKIAVEKTRQLLVEENSYRISFMEDVGHRRRNATCVEIDDALKNAVQLLRDLFLRKTMEELCMLW